MIRETTVSVSVDLFIFIIHFSNILPVKYGFTCQKAVPLIDLTLFIISLHITEHLLRAGWCIGFFKERETHSFCLYKAYSLYWENQENQWSHYYKIVFPWCYRMMGPVLVGSNSWCDTMLLHKWKYLSVVPGMVWVIYKDLEFISLWPKL